MDKAIDVSEAVRFRRSPDIIAAPHADRVVLLNLADNSYHSLNEIGAAVWQLLDNGRSIDEIVRALSDEYDAPIEVLRNDVERFIGELCRCRFVVSAR